MTTTTTAMTAYPSPQLSRAKSSTNLLDRIKLEQSKLEEQLVIEYLNQTLDLSIELGNLQHELKDGVILCNLVNHIRPGTIKMISQQQKKKEFSFIQMDNITRFLQGVRQLGMDEQRLFNPVDLHSGKDMSAVIHTILTLAEFSVTITEGGSQDCTSTTNSIAALLDKETEECQRQGETNDDEGDKQKSPQYRHIRDIFSSPEPTKSNSTSILRVNTNSSTKETNNSNRPPKSPLRRPKKRSGSVCSTTSTCSTASSNNNFPMTPPTPTATAAGGMMRPKRDAKSVILEHPSSPSPVVPVKSRKSISATTDRHQVVEEVAPQHGVGKIILNDDEGNPITTYQLGNCIGKGQFGSVYRTLDLSTGEVVAVKRVKLEDEDLYKEIMKEVNILKTLSHTNVVQYIGFIPTDQHLNIVLEFAENGSLMSTLKAFGAFPEKLVASFCIKILRGLEYLHDNDVVHCDLKAANILTTKTGDVKLTDFGVSLNLKLKAVDADTISGTPNWMAPEVIELKGATTKSDIWSLGCTLVELVTGKPPYGDLLAMSAMFRIVEDDYPPLPPNVSQNMKDFLLCCFQKDPEQRSSSKELQKHVWIEKHLKKSTPPSLSKATREIPGHPSTSSYNLETQQQHEASRNKKKQAASSNNKAKYYSLNASTIGHPPSSSSFDDSSSHMFIETTFGKEVECKVCSDVMNAESVFCEICSLVCHKECKPAAFSCPPRVNDQQPSYDWVFSAKIYNRTGSNTMAARGSSALHSGVKGSSSLRETRTTHKTNSLRNHPQADSIRKYSRALGLTEQEQLALCENPALLMHTIAMEKSSLLPSTAAAAAAAVAQDHTLLEKFIKKRKDKKSLSHEEQCIIS